MSLGVGKGSGHVTLWGHSNDHFPAGFRNSPSAAVHGGAHVIPQQMAALVHVSERPNQGGLSSTQVSFWASEAKMKDISQTFQLFTLLHECYCLPATLLQNWAASSAKADGKSCRESPKETK